MEKKTEQIGIRVTAEFKQKLELQADRERRNVSNMIFNILSEYLENERTTKRSIRSVDHEKELYEQFAFYDPGDSRLSREDSRKLIGLLALETGLAPMELPPLLSEIGRELLRLPPEEAAYDRLAMRLAVEELKRLIEEHQQKGEA